MLTVTLRSSAKVSPSVLAVTVTLVGAASSGTRAGSADSVISV